MLSIKMIVTISTGKDFSCVYERSVQLGSIRGHETTLQNGIVPNWITFTSGLIWYRIEEPIQNESARSLINGGDTNRPVKKLVCYSGVMSNFPFSSSGNWPLRISTFLAGGNCIKENRPRFQDKLNDE